MKKKCLEERGKGFNRDGLRKEKRERKKKKGKWHPILNEDSIVIKKKRKEAHGCRSIISMLVAWVATWKNKSG